ncbi:MAG: exosome complex RNA-binding protein Csl4 [Thermoproteota archaeon]
MGKSMMMGLHNRLVLAGEALATLEEFFPGEGTFEHKGVIYSSLVGMVNVDMAGRKIRVLELRSIPMSKPGCKIIGSITSFSGHYANAEIFYIDGFKLSHEYSGVVAVESFRGVYQRFRTKDLRSYIRENDIIYGEILSNVNVNLIDLSQKEYGVIKAYCSMCGNPLMLYGKYLLCLSCRRKEDRKVSIFYDSPIERLVRTG